MSARHSRKPSIKAIVVSSVLVVLAGVGSAIGADLWSGAKHVAGDSGQAASNSAGSSGSSQTRGTLTLDQAVRNYYPNNGILPTLPPPNYDHNDIQQREDFCGIWADWARNVKAASDMPVMSLTTVAGATSTITVLDLHAVVYSTHSVTSRNLLPCQYAAGGYVGTTANIDLDHPRAPTRLDIGVDGEQHTTLPGGRFAVDPKNAENLYIYLTGSPGVVYEYGIELKVVENSHEETRTFGSRSHPYRLAFVGDFDATNAHYWRWDYSTGKWVTMGPNDEPK